MHYRILLIFLLFFFTYPCLAEEEFLVTKSKMVNMRSGPGKDYDVRWIYTLRFVPFKVLYRVDRWVKVEDIGGTTGWIMAHLLHKRPYALTVKDDTHVLASAKDKSKVVFTTDAGVIMKVEKCKNDFCKVEVKKMKGWTKKSNLWGVISMY